MATLYEIRENLETVIAGGFVVDEITGEILYDSDNLDALEDSYTDKLEACGLFIKDLEGTAKMIRAEEKALAERRRVMENKAARLREYVLANVLDNGRLDTPRVAFSIRNVEAVEVENVEDVPEAYRRVTVAPDKVAIKAAIKSGKAVEGAELVTRQSLQVK